jgi:hypothetical protein
MRSCKVLKLKLRKELHESDEKSVELISPLRSEINKKYHAGLVAQNDDHD